MSCALPFSLHAAECIVLLMTLRLIINPIASVRTNLFMFCQYTCILESWGQEKRAGTGRGSGGRRGQGKAVEERGKEAQPETVTYKKVADERGEEARGRRREGWMVIMIRSML